MVMYIMCIILFITPIAKFQNQCTKSFVRKLKIRDFVLTNLLLSLNQVPTLTTYLYIIVEEKVSISNKFIFVELHDKIAQRGSHMLMNVLIIAIE